MIISDNPTTILLRTPLREIRHGFASRNMAEVQIWPLNGVARTT
jgi:hypothetical protein